MAEWFQGIVIALQLVFDVAILFVGIFRSDRKAMEKIVETQANKIIDARFALAETESKKATEALAHSIDSIKEDLSHGDALFAKIEDRDRKRDLEVLGHIESVKEFVREQVGAHQEKMEKKIDAMSGNLGKMGESLARLDERDRIKRGS